ncbi:MAG TPA: hypothetical protein VMU54_04010 [Planctomycetota bacterium]|nr:hypothetical protein [Planctomycetota bacterium]
MASNRTYLGTDRKLWGIIRVYLRPDSLEIDEITFAEIERTRVLFDEVLAVTYHRAISLGFSVVLSIAGVVLLAIALIAALQDKAPAAVILFVFAGPLLFTLILHLIVKNDFITVFGKRTIARMRFRVRKRRAREVFRELTERIRAAQAAAAAAQPAPPPPESPELPPGPPVGANPN